MNHLNIVICETYVFPDGSVPGLLWAIYSVSRNVMRLVFSIHSVSLWAHQCSIGSEKGLFIWWWVCVIWTQRPFSEDIMFQMQSFVLKDILGVLPCVCVWICVCVCVFGFVCRVTWCMRSEKICNTFAISCVSMISCFLCCLNVFFKVHFLSWAHMNTWTLSGVGNLEHTKWN